MLKYDPYDYLNTQELKYSQHYTEAELKSAYSYLRNIANKRITRLETAGFTQGMQYQRLKALGMPYLREIRNRSELSMRLQQVAYFVTLQSSTVSGIRKIRAQKLRQFQEQGFLITEKDLDSFISFFEEMKQASKKFYTVELAEKIYNYSAREKIRPERIIANYKKIAKRLGHNKGE